ncbi:peptidylprolyl isomerase [Marinifilum caeruleilacunae]|uniref:peptidylprolyl isomerase n=1 Tax=Marinifilum caeruleilacunae TaxID=2499076 RepID=A0ABX1WZU2_9BACT|nr:peptidylprolyl isomerase [Marinifilum caeruleilacunae]NOU61584.1 peptidylprolyl isomerase [Marinifilum caeruleilacunae]
MRKINLFLILFLFLIPTKNSLAQSTNSIILIETNMGNMKIMLYKETPKHRQNFLQLVENDHFDGTLFYRVIKGFVAQGGSQDSRNAPAGKMIGYGDANRTIESEFHPKFFHKKGAIASPRQPDKVNIFKESDVSQFYIAHGRVFTDAELTAMEKEVNVPLRKRIVKRYLTPKKRQILDSLKKAKKVEEFRAIANKIKESIDFDYSAAREKLEFTPEQRKAYTTVGGVPHLDANYTVFGEVISGLEVLDKIVNLKTDGNDRPYTDVKMKVKILQY